MALKRITVDMKGIVPLILHNGQIANPLSVHAKELKRLTSKRKKTDSDYHLIADLEWLVSWYFDRNQLDFGVSSTAISVGDHGTLIIPESVIFACILNGAKKIRLGQQFKSGVFVEGDARLDIGSTESLAKLMHTPDYRLESLERVGTAKILRTRPYIRNWSASFDLQFDDTVVNEGEIEQAMTAAGKLVGIGERRPRNGRFDAKLTPAK